MDVRPPAGVAGREDAGEGDPAEAVGDLDAAQVVLLGHAAGVERVPPLAIAVPDVDGGAGQGFAVEVADHQAEAQRHTFGPSGRGAEGAPDVTADHPGDGTYVDAVGAVRGERPLSLCIRDRHGEHPPAGHGAQVERQTFVVHLADVGVVLRI